MPHRKLGEAAHGGRVTERYLDYAMRDTLATWECYTALRDRFAKWGLAQTALHTLHTEASVGKAYLKAMNVRPWLEVQPDIPRDVVGAVMSAYFGGRSEVHIRRTVAQVQYCDFLSMYPTVSVLMGLWKFVTARGVTWSDATDDTRCLLDGITLTELQHPAFWPSLTTLVQVKPDNDIFPVRAKYAVGDEQYRLALNYLTSETPLWFTLADCIASKLLTGKAPRVLKAWRFLPGSVQQDITPINIAGNPDYRVDPAKEDFYKRLIDLRRDIQQRAKSATGPQATALKHEQLAAKNVANATTYGIFIELNVEDTPDGTVGMCYGPGKAFAVRTDRFEQPGAYFHPLVAVFTTGAARLMLATSERLVRDAGLDWAFCDTDSMALAKPETISKAEFLRRAEAVRNWFVPLNPYSQKGPVFKIETENYAVEDGRVSERLETLFCYAISPKRYALFNRDKSGNPIIRKALAHGLGHLLAPFEDSQIPSDIPAPSIPLKEMEIAGWQYSLWHRIVEAALSPNPDSPRIADLPGFRRPAATRYGASTVSVLGWCKGYNRARSYRDQIKPFNFLLRFYSKLPIGGRAMHAGERPSARQRQRSVKGQLRPIAPFDRNANQAANCCFDRATGALIPPENLSTCAEELAQYHLHPDSKVFGAEHFDRGATRRRHVVAMQVHHIGKEADDLEAQLEHGLDPDAVMDYGIGPNSNRITLETLRLILNEANLSRLEMASGISRQTLTSIRDGKRIPKRRTARRIALGIQRLSIAERQRTKDRDGLLAFARAERKRIGLRELARQLGFDHSTVAQVLDGKRIATDTLQEQMETLKSRHRVD